MEKEPMTKQGFATLQAELKKRTGLERHAIVKAIAEARAHGDLSENAEYHAAKEQQGLNEARISELESILSRAEIIDIASIKSDTIRFGATIKLADIETGDEVEYKIVGAQEADAKAGKISLSSPVAKALIGKQCGEDVVVKIPSGTKTYEILKIEYIA